MIHKERTLNLSYDHLVLGSSLESVLFAYYTSTPLIYLHLDRPQWFEKYSFDFGLGLSKEESFDSMLAQMGIAGLLPLDNKCNRARMMDGNNIRIVTTGDFIVNIGFNNLYIFDDTKVDGLPDALEKTHTPVTIYDSFLINCSRASKIEIDLSTEAYIKNFHHVDNPNSTRKECVVVSEAEREEDSMEYFIRARLETVLKESGIKKKRNKELVEHIERKVKNSMKNLYADYGGIKFIYPNLDTIIEHRETHNRNDYLGYIKCQLSQPT
jgi:hypothetical protein